MSGQRSVMFAANQLRGLYHFARYREAVASLGVPGKPARRCVGKGDVTDLLAQDAAQAVADITRDVWSIGIDTLDWRQWASLADALCSVMRLSVSNDGHAVACAQNVAMLVEAYGMASDGEAGADLQEAEFRFDDEGRVDIVRSLADGRGSLWLDWACNQGRVCAAMAGLSWTDCVRDYAVVRMAATALVVAGSRGVADGVALEETYAGLFEYADAFDDMQFDTYERREAMGDAAWSFDESVVDRAVASVPGVMDLLSDRPAADGDARGICAVTGVSAIDCVRLRP